MEQSHSSASRKTRESQPEDVTGSPAPNGSSPAKSMKKADTVFKDFSLSRFPDGSKPASYVDPADGPVAVHSAQREIITRQLDTLNAMNTSGGMTLALPESQIGKLLPSLNAKAATIDLGDVLDVIARYMTGAEFYADGNPVLNRLALQARARELIAAMKQDPRSDTQKEAEAGAPLQRVKAALRGRR